MSSLESLGVMLTLVSKSPRIRLSKTGDPRFFEQTIMQSFTRTVKILPHRYNSSRFAFVLFKTETILELDHCY